MTTVLFWDIDGTLLNSGGAGRLAMAEAATEMLGKPTDLSDVNMAGLTDWAIGTRIFEQIGISPSSAKILELLSLYQEYLPTSLRKTQGYVLDGVFEILETLHKRHDVLSILLTGNIEFGAQAKLSHYRLDAYFTLGAFCQESSERIEIAHQALAIAQKQLGTVNFDKCYLLGDTPHDIRCARAIGAKTIAIASGGYSIFELASHKSWLVWESFPSPEFFMETIGLI